MNALRSQLCRTTTRSYTTSPSSLCIISSSKALHALGISPSSSATSSSRSYQTGSHARYLTSYTSSASSTSRSNVGGYIGTRSASSTSATAPISSSAPPPPPIVVPTQSTIPVINTTATSTAPATKRRVVPKARKAAITLTPEAVLRIRSLLSSPTPKLIRIGVRNKGCAGMSYHLEYVDSPSRFDEVVEQDGVKVIVDSRALFSVIGSEMDWQEDALQAKFVFKNPNIKDACGCGESFIV